MRKTFRYLIFVSLLLIMSFATKPGSSAVVPDTCQDACFAAYQACFDFNSPKSEQRKCLAQYRRCIAHCK